MKSNALFLLILICSFPALLHAQVGIGTSTPDGSAALEIEATDKGLLIPRIADPSTISNPAHGLILYNTGTSQIQVNQGTGSNPDWQNITPGGLWADSSAYALFSPALSNADTVVFTDQGEMGIGTTQPRGAVDIQSTTGALILPRMTSSEASQIPQINGSMIYITSSGPDFDQTGFWFFENGAWVKK